MFFEDHQKMIYTPSPGCLPDGRASQKFDPLAIDRALMVATGNALARLVEDWKAVDRDEGDISPQGRAATIERSCRAEETLANAARVAFALPAFPDCTDAVALELLCDYLEWLKKKGTRESTPPGSITSAAPTSPIPTKSS